MRDACDRKQVAELVSWTITHAGPIDGLVYSAGMNVAKRTFADIDPEDFDRVTAANASRAFNCLHAVLPGMRARKSGLILNIVSLGGLRVLPVSGLPCTAAKFAQAAIGTFTNRECRSSSPAAPPATPPAACSSSTAVGRAQ